MNRYYHLLQNSIIPNCRINLPILYQYYTVSRDVENYVLTGTTAKVRVQRLLNFLLVNLDNEKDSMKFCVVINSISVMTNLPYRMIAGSEGRLVCKKTSLICSSNYIPVFN